MAAETQAFIDEAKTSGPAVRQQIADAVRAMVPEMGQAAEKFETLARLLAVAEVTETDEAVRQMIPEGFQKLGAARREGGKLEAAARAEASIVRELVDWFQRFRQACIDAGYTG